MIDARRSFYMKKEKGFTLVELLAIIVVLAVVALTTGPIIIGVIETSKKKAFEKSVDGITEAIRINNAGAEYVAESFVIQDGVIQKKDGSTVSKTGGNGENGTASIDINGNIAMAVHNGTWCATKEATGNTIVIAKYDKQKCQYFPSDNLVTNGDGSYGYNLNFPQLTFVKEGDKGYFTDRTAYSIMSDEFIQIDPNGTYTISADMKSSNTTSTYYIGAAEYDIDHKDIRAPHYKYIENTLTTLTKELKKGDTEVYVNDLTNFYSASTTHSNNLGLIFWNYKDSTGYTYPALTYSRNAWTTLYTYNNIDKVGKKIKLTVPWAYDTVPTGTKLSQSQSGRTFNYVAKEATTATANWVNYKGTIKGTGVGPGDTVNQFRPGTRYIKFFIYSNFNGIANTTSYFKNLQIKKG